ncbi:MAG: GrdX family protein [Suipraeoptans sp.]
MEFNVITNNPLVLKELNGKYDVKYHDTDFKGVLIKIRDEVYIGKKLLTHPLSGSIKPNETPYKSVLISKDSFKTDTESVILIENAIAATDKFLFKPEPKDSSSLADMQLIDYTLLSSALASADA